MANRDQKSQNPQEQKPTPQPTNPAQPVELTDEELGHIAGGPVFPSGPGHAQPDPTTVE